MNLFPLFSRRLFAVGAGALLGFAGLADAAYTGPFTYSWDFSTGLQGWAITGAGSWDSGTQSLTLGGTSFATIAPPVTIGAEAAPSYALTNKAFVMQADVTIFNTQWLAGSGIGALRSSDDKGPQFGGDNTGTNGRAFGRSTEWDNISYGRNFDYTSGSLNPATASQTIQIQIDYGYSEIGKWRASYKLPYANDRGVAANTWFDFVGVATGTAVGQREVHPTNQTFDLLRIGDLVSPGNNSGTVLKFDNVKLQVAPEPSCIVMLGFASVLMLRRRRTS